LRGSGVVNDVRNVNNGQGLNAITGEIVDLVAAGIIDPATGHALGAPERSVNRQEHPHHRGDRRRDSRHKNAGGAVPDMSGMMQLER
jgi:chaperonin GroEL